MKLTTRGFTLVELMIVIAIIGILAAALFPSVAGYIQRGRDAARASHLKDITNALGAYFSDYEKYPTSAPNGCLNSWALDAKYLPSFPLDPTNGHENGCGANGNYGYAWGTGSISSPQFIVTAGFETQWGGNYDNSSWAQVSIRSLVGTWEFTFAERTALDAVWIIRKWNGSGYIMYK